MVSLALSTLIYEWRRYSAAVIALALSGLLILAVTGMFIGIGKAISAFLDRSQADIIILTANATSLDDTGSIPARVQPGLYLHPEVVRVAPMAGGGAQWRNEPKAGAAQKSTWPRIYGFEADRSSPTLPRDFPEEARRALEEPFTVVVDKSALKALGVQLGDTASLAGRKVRVAAVLEDFPNIMNTQVFTSRETARMLGLTNESVSTGPLMVSIRDPLRAQTVRAELNAMAAGKYKAWTREELAKANETLVFSEQIVGILLGFMVFLGFVIGIGVTSQTLRGAIMANIKELASLRALGVSMGSLRLLILELSFWVGVVGIALAGVLVWGVTLIGESLGLMMAYPPLAVAGVVGLLLLVALLSGVLSLGVLKKSQPADLLR